LAPYEGFGAKSFPSNFYAPPSKLKFHSVKSLGF